MTGKMLSDVTPILPFDISCIVFSCFLLFYVCHSYSYSVPAGESCHFGRFGAGCGGLRRVVGQVVGQVIGLVGPSGAVRHRVHGGFW